MLMQQQEHMQQENEINKNGGSILCIRAMRSAYVAFFCVAAIETMWHLRTSVGDSNRSLANNWLSKPYF